MGAPPTRAAPPCPPPAWENGEPPKMTNRKPRSKKLPQPAEQPALTAVEPLAGVGPWGRPRVIGDPFKYYGWEGYHWIELNE